eukprot:2626008-Rhodomonas_salina.2
MTPFLKQHASAAEEAGGAWAVLQVFLPSLACLGTSVAVSLASGLIQPLALQAPARAMPLVPETQVRVSDFTA